MAAGLAIAVMACWTLHQAALTLAGSPPRPALKASPLLSCNILWSLPQRAAGPALESLQSASALLLRQVNGRVPDSSQHWRAQQQSKSPGPNPVADSTSHQEELLRALPCQVTLQLTLARPGSSSPQPLAGFPHLWAHDESFNLSTSLLAEGDQHSSLVRSIVISAVSLPGLMRGVGGFLRLLTFDQGQPSLAASAFHTRPQLFLSSAQDPSKSSVYIRGMQLSYRQTSNSFDTWSVEQMQSYLDDLVVFGSNMVELVAPDGNADPHFTLDPPAMNAAISEMAAKMGLNVSLWYPYQPGMEPPFGTWWESLPILNSLFVPGGDGSSGTLQQLISALDATMDQLQAQHPDCQVWISTQEWNQTELDQFYDLLRTGPPSWLTGVVYGPHTRVTLEATRAAVPNSFPIRHYPDICHQLKSEFPQPTWVRTSKSHSLHIEGSLDHVLCKLELYSQLFQFHAVSTSHPKYLEKCNNSN